MMTLTAIMAGYIADLFIGDPEWLPHPIRLIGWCIAKGEEQLRQRYPDTPQGKRKAGTVLAIGVIGLVTFSAWSLLTVAYAIHPMLAWVVEAVMCYQIMATKSLKDESMKVYHALRAGDLAKSRYQVSRIVGRDTDQLDTTGITKATIETVAENTSDGVIGPLLFLMIGGAPLGFAYKAVNTLDSMIGYKNERYSDFGRFAAKLDDAVNYIPARLAAYMMLGATACLGYNTQQAYRIYHRDKTNHASPNSAHTEAVCAGALGIQLAGDAIYFGKRYTKPTIGDAMQTVQIEHIKEANRLLYGTSLLAFAVGVLVRTVIFVA